MLSNWILAVNNLNFFWDEEVVVDTRL